MAMLESVAEDPESGRLSSEVSTLTLKQSSAAAGARSAAPCLIPSFADACKLVDAPYSCLVVESHRRHVALSPLYLRKKKSGIEEQLSAELLKYSESLKGVPLSYDGIKVLGEHGDIYDDNGFIHMNIEATFVIFQPKRGQKLCGVINKVGVSHVGCLVHGCFNAAVPRPPQVTQEAWLQAGLNVGCTLEFKVSQLDADTAGVLLIRGRLDKHRVQTLATLGEVNGAGFTEEMTNETAAGKRKKNKSALKDLLGVCEVTDKSSAGELGVTETGVDPEVNGCEEDGRKRKKKKKRKSEEEVFEHDSCGYHSDKSSRKRKYDVDAREGPEPSHSPEEPEPKKKKKNKRCSQEGQS